MYRITFSTNKLLITLKSLSIKFKTILKKSMILKWNKFSKKIYLKKWLKEFKVLWTNNLKNSKFIKLLILVRKSNNLETIWIPQTCLISIIKKTLTPCYKTANLRFMKLDDLSITLHLPFNLIYLDLVSRASEFNSTSI